MEHTIFKPVSICVQLVLIISVLLGALTAEARPRRQGRGGSCPMRVDCSRNNDVMKCMTCNAFREAGNQSMAGQIEVNRTVLARVNSGSYPNNICAVIYQRAQFSWTASPRTCTTPSAWKRAQDAVRGALKAGSNGILHFYANYVRPRWARTCRIEKIIGAHIFCNPTRTVSRYAKKYQRPRVAARRPNRPQNGGGAHATR